MCSWVRLSETEIVPSNGLGFGEASRSRILTRILYSSWLSRLKEIPMMTNMADRSGRSSSLHKLAHPCWIVHKTAKLVGNNGALVQGGRLGVGAMVLMCDGGQGSGSVLSDIGARKYTLGPDIKAPIRHSSQYLDVLPRVVA
jgi:hypothetical protein